MFSSPDEPSNPTARVSSQPIATFLYLGAEVLVAALISLLLVTLALLKRLLPKPPRDLTNDTVVITGAGSILGKSVAEEFLKAGCIVACVDKNLNSNSINEANPNLNPHKERIEKLQPNEVLTQRKIYTYKCDLANRGDIINVAEEIRRDIGRVDILITCIGNSSQNILDVVSTNLMSHYWTMLAFIPAMIQCKRSNIVAVIPGTSNEDAYISSKAAVAGLVEAIAQQLSNANQLTFTTVAPQARYTYRSMKLSEQVARDIVRAVRRDQRTLSTNWGFDILYSVCIMLHRAITGFTSWLYRQNCDELFE